VADGANAIGGLNPRLRKGVFWALVSTGFVQGSTFVVNILIARILGREAFGEFAIVLSTLLSITTMAQLALGATATRYVAELRATDSQRTGRVIALLSAVALITGVIAGGAMLAASGWVAGSVLGADRLAVPMAIGSAHVAFATLSGLQTGALAGFEAYRSLARASIIAGCVYVVACVGGALIGGLAGIVGGMGLSAAIHSLTLLYFERREERIAGVRRDYRHCLTELRCISRYAVPAALSGYVSIPAIWWAQAVLARQPLGFAELALYNAAFSFRTLILVVPNNVNRVAGSVLYHVLGKKDGVSYRHIFWTNMSICFGFVLIAGLIVVALDVHLLGLYGDGFASGSITLRLLMLSGLLEALAFAGYQTIQSQRRMWLSAFAIALPSYGALAVTATLLAPAYGAAGLGVASIAAWSVQLIAIGLIVHRTGVGMSTRVGSAVQAA
jgi:O-antigen/teichoic acid export membrane protein